MIELLSGEGTPFLETFDVIACLALQQIPCGIIRLASENHEASTRGIKNRLRLATVENQHATRIVWLATHCPGHGRYRNPSARRLSSE